MTIDKTMFNSVRFQQQQHDVVCVCVLYYHYCTFLGLGLVMISYKNKIAKVRSITPISMADPVTTPFKYACTNSTNTPVFAMHPLELLLEGEGVRMMGCDGVSVYYSPAHLPDRLFAGSREIM